ncbi:ribosome small subunit-dependent GTPase A [Leifsonia sp. F6_8S_P_1B]|uniref:Small ribosomal subunit biogenesis GTPase RsgA n=1 Tax=Leifsonia williamsii TaxID=3035919 RepID=A0ABT8K6E4_9MICO|nr:ribosome small subunit-dependent GTPase A [Leifsonia williamsii]MDN4613014.1 ribosome small subunit-dependent GTPase A [Leifsonia williamsii]
MAETIDVASPAGETLRVIRIDRTAAVLAADGDTDGFLVPLRGAELAVGDWVQLDAEQSMRRLERTSSVVRAKEGGAAQVLAANVDVAFLVVSLEEAHRPGVLERLASLGWESGAVPHYVVTKCDLGSAEERAAVGSLIETTAPGIPTSFVSAWTDEGRTELLALLPAGRTGVLLGHSGVGKSTLLNWLGGTDVAAVGEVRERDSKGRHTTTVRSLRMLPDAGGSIVDTPGLREIGMGSPSAVQSVFAEVTALADACRFADCAHVRDAGCAVTAALAAGELDASRYRRYLSTLAEARRNEGTVGRGTQQRRDKGREYSRLAREFRRVRGH